jgi:exonuclease SbcC
MKPIERRLEGITSFRQPTKIDFSQLELFAITGPTGAGKSSLIDAITLALYGKIARGTKPDELLSSGSDKLQVTFRFLGADDAEYQVSRTRSFRTKTPKTIFKPLRRTRNHLENKKPKISLLT